MKKIVVILSLLLSISLSASDIKGRIISAGSSEGLPFATIKAVRHDVGALSDSIGGFSIRIPENDSVKITYVGYNDTVVAVRALSADGLIMLTPKSFDLDEVIVMPQGKPKHKTYGKKSKGGIAGVADRFEIGDAFGLRVKENNRRTWLTDVGFYVTPTPGMMTHTLLQINVYDYSKVDKLPTDKLIDVLQEPIFVKFTQENIINGKFSYKLSEPILLPENAFVEFVFLENGGFINYRCNILSGNGWFRTRNERYWDKTPFATPFFIECDVYKVPKR